MCLIVVDKMLVFLCTRTITTVHLTNDNTFHSLYYALIYTGFTLQIISTTFKSLQKHVYTQILESS